MKHKWKPDGQREHKYCEARCTKCEITVDSGAHWVDGEKIKEFWNRISKRNDCPERKNNVTSK